MVIGRRMGQFGLGSGWYERNRALIWVCALIAVNQLGFGAIVPAVPLYAHAFDVPQSAIGVTIAIYGLARFLLSMPAGQLSDGFGRRATLTAGCLLTALGSLLCALASSYWPFLGARFVAGAGAAFVLTAAQIVLADISTPERRGRLMAIFSGVFIFSVGIGPYPGGLLVEHYGLPAPFFAYAILGTLAAALGWFGMPETRGLRAGGRSEPDVAMPPFRAQLRILTAHRGFLLVSLISFGGFFARTGALFNVIPVLGKERLGLTADQIGLGLGIVSIVGLILAYPSGALVDRFGRKSVIVPATLLTATSLVLFVLAPSYSWFLAGCLAWSIAAGISGPAPAAYAADVAPTGMNAAAMSTYRTLADSGYVVGPLAIGLAADLLGADASLAGTAAMLAVVTFLFARFAPETHRASERR